jgi:hypothetical protein
MNTSPLALNPPRVPVAVANGGLRWLDLSDPSAPVQVQAVLTPNSARPGDLFVLYWQAENAASVTANPDHMQIGVVTFSVLPADILRFVDGDHSLYYTVTSVIGGSTEQSPLTMVKVKRLIPGGYDPDAGSEYINENLKSPLGIPNLIDDSVQSVTVTIPDYENREDDDTVQVDWSGHRITTPDAASPLGFTVTRAILEATPGRVICRYDVRDVVNNWSKWSLSTETESEVGDDFLLAPRVIDAVDGIIDLAVLGDGDARVQVAPYNLKASGLEPRMVIGDQVQLTWTGYTAEGSPLEDVESEKTVASDDVGWPLDFVIPNAKIKLIPQGRAVVRYYVTPLVGASKGSRRTTVQVIGQVQLLPAPLVLEQSGGVLDPTELPATGATVRIEASDLIVTGDTVVLKWDGLTQAGTPLLYSITVPVTEDVVGKPISRIVALQYITPLIDGSVVVSYEVDKVVETLRSLSLPLGINVNEERPVILTITGAAGEVGNGGTTVDTSLSLKGTAAQNVEVEIFDGGTLKGRATAADDGSWATSAIVFPVGLHQITAKTVGGVKPSIPWTFTTVAQAIEGLKAPTFPHADIWGYLNCCSVPRVWEGITVRVEGNVNFSDLDRVELTWQGCDSLNGTKPIPGATRTFITTLDAGQAANGFDIVVPYDNLVEPLINNSSGTAQYVLVKTDGRTGMSEKDFVKVIRLMPSGEVCSPFNDLCAGGLEKNQTVTKIHKKSK